MKKYKGIFIRTLLIIFFMLIIFIYFLNKVILPYIVNYASVQTKRVGIEVLRNTGLIEVNKKIKEGASLNIVKNSNGDIESIDFDTTLLNEVLILVSKSVRKKLKDLEQGKDLPEEMYGVKYNKLAKGMIYEVPLFLSSKNVLVANLGPKIPIKISYSGNVGLDVKTRIKEYGINSALIEIYIYVEVTQRTIAPLISKDVILTSEIPVIIKLVKGSIPNYLITK